MSNSSSPTVYRGRFAPSPTGPLHLGSLVAALGSCLDARANGGLWFVRIEDIDRPRCRPAAADAILRLLEAYGFEWDGPVCYQSCRDSLYHAAFAQLQALALVYPCACTRSELADSRIGHSPQRAVDGGWVYPGTCRKGLPAERAARAWRMQLDDGLIAFEDAIHGRIEQALAREVGDFVLRRADGLYAYQLAVVVDDAEQGVTHIVRGADLLDSTPRQILLQARLGLSTPHYAHLPVVLNAQGEKLSKQTQAMPLEACQALPALLCALDFLGQHPPVELRSATLNEVWQWAVAHWSLNRVPPVHTVAKPIDCFQE